MLKFSRIIFVCRHEMDLFVFPPHYCVCFYICKPIEINHNALYVFFFPYSQRNMTKLFQKNGVKINQSIISTTDIR